MNTMKKAIEDHETESEAAFYAAPQTAGTENPTGIHPVEYNCLVRLDPIEEKVGNIILPDGRQDKDQMAQTYATLIEVGGNCFADWDEPIPRPGNRILINKYAGQTPKAGDFTDLYRVCTDKDIVAIVSE